MIAGERKYDFFSTRQKINEFIGMKKIIQTGLIRDIAADS